MNKHIAIDRGDGHTDTLPVNTQAEIHTAARHLADLGLEQAEVLVGEPGDEVRTGQVVFAERGSGMADG